MNPTVRFQSRRRYAVLAVLVLFLPACGTVGQLERFKELSGQQKYTEIAAQEVRCQPTEAGCNQLHLIKGDACFRLLDLVNVQRYK